MEALFQFGYIGLFLGSFLSATVLPLSSEGILMLMLANKYNIYAVITIASLGNWLGGLSCYFLGYLGNWKLIEKYLKINQQKLTFLQKWLNKFGGLMAFFCWLPFIGDFIALALGLSKYNFITVASLMLMGKTFRYLIIAYITIFGMNQL